MFYLQSRLTPVLVHAHLAPVALGPFIVLLFCSPSETFFIHLTVHPTRMGGEGNEEEEKNMGEYGGLRGSSYVQIGHFEKSEKGIK